MAAEEIPQVVCDEIAIIYF